MSAAPVKDGAGFHSLHSPPQHLIHYIICCLNSCSVTIGCWMKSSRNKSDCLTGGWRGAGRRVWMSRVTYLEEEGSTEQYLAFPFSFPAHCLLLYFWINFTHFVYVSLYGFFPHLYVFFEALPCLHKTLSHSKEKATLHSSLWSFHNWLFQEQSLSFFTSYCPGYILCCSLPHLCSGSSWDRKENSTWNPTKLRKVEEPVEPEYLIHWKYFIHFLFLVTVLQPSIPHICFMLAIDLALLTQSQAPQGQGVKSAFTSTMHNTWHHPSPWQVSKVQRWGRCI